MNRAFLSLDSIARSYADQRAKSKLAGNWTNITWAGPPITLVKDWREAQRTGSTARATHSIASGYDRTRQGAVDLLGFQFPRSAIHHRQ
jgi:hypothetical protein